MTTSLPHPEQSILSTPATEKGVKDFFNGLCAIQETLTYSAPAQVALAITPSLAGLLEQFCGTDPRYKRVMAEVWIRDYKAIRDSTPLPHENTKRRFLPLIVVAVIALIIGGATIGAITKAAWQNHANGWESLAMQYKALCSPTVDRPPERILKPLPSQEKP